MAIGVHVYYLPILFQSALGVTAVQSGIRILPYLMTLLIAPLMSGSLIALVGYYFPFMWIGSALMTIGSGLLFTLAPTDSTGHWIGYQFLAAFGAGICRQIPFSAVPLVLAKDDLPVASALVAFCNSLGPTLAVGIGQPILTNKVAQQLTTVPGINVTAVMDEGAFNLNTLMTRPFISVVRSAFHDALKGTFALAVASAGMAFCCSLAMERISVRK